MMAPNEVGGSLQVKVAELSTLLREGVVGKLDDAVEAIGGLEDRVAEMDKTVALTKQELGNVTKVVEEWDRHKKRVQQVDRRGSWALALAVLSIIGGLITALVVSNGK